MSSSEGIPPDRETLFVTTRWTMVLQAGREGSPQSGQALEELCRTYWFPLYAFVRRRGYGKEDAEDLVQGFFLRLLDKNYLQSVSSDQGKFRAFLLACLKHFLANEWDRAGRQKRGGGGAPLSLNWADAHSRYELGPADGLTPDRLYDRAWAILLLERVLAQLRVENAGDLRLFDALKPFLTMGKSAIPYAQAAAAVGLSESAARVAVHRLRRRYRELLRREVAETLSRPEQVEEEMRALLGAFAG